jgi:hypothetical protein
MSAERFRALLTAYGADLARWPEEARAAAATLVTTSRDAARWIEDERRLDAMLDGASMVEPSADLLRKVAEIPARNERVGWLAPFGRLRRLLVGAFALAAVGAVVGTVTPENPEPGSVIEASSDDLSPFSWAGDLAEELSP